MEICKFLSEQLLLIPEQELMSFASSAPFRYKKYRIPKRGSVETRLIAQPSRQVKFIQRVVVGILKETLAASKYATAYVDNVGIRDNATAHSANKYLLKMDFKNFFLSVTPELLFWVMEKKYINISPQDKQLITGLFFWKLRRNSPLRLSIGAPSSPLISNFVMTLFDEEISKICDEKKIIYTRYADDITFSSSVKGVLFELPKVVKATLKTTTKGKIIVNSTKTVFSSKAHNRHVTGVTLTNEGKTSIGRNKKRYIFSLVHKYTLSLLDKEAVLNLQGLISFANYIEGDFIERLVKKYGEVTIESLLSVK